MALNNYKIITSFSNTNPTDKELIILHSFFITYSLCENLSFRKRNLSDYGHNGIRAINEQLKAIINLDSANFNIIKKKSLQNDDLCNNYLNDAHLNDLSCERASFVKLDESNKYFELFHHIRNSLAHGAYSIIERNDEKNMIMQSNDGQQIKSRMILKLSSLMHIIDIIDQNNLIEK